MLETIAVVVVLPRAGDSDTVAKTHQLRQHFQRGGSPGCARSRAATISGFYRRRRR